MRKSAYEGLTLEEALRVLYYQFGDNPKLLTAHVHTLLAYADEPYQVIAPVWFKEYKEYLNDNKKEKPCYQNNYFSPGTR